jgi:outer membrane protein OmpA-like peptidoglycan-associated protein
MRTSTLFSTAIAALGLLSLSTEAKAQNIGDLSLRLQPGLAIPVWAPQDQRFLPGVDLAAKVGITVCPWFDFGPSISELVLASNVAGVSPGTATFLGGFARIKRSHQNASTGFAAVSPWIDSDIAYVRTGDLDRFGFDISLGASWPTSSGREVWVGPFIEGKNIFESNHVGLNSNDDHTLIVGLSIEFGGGVKTTPAAPVCPACQNTTTTVVETKEVPVAAAETKVEYVETIQFAVNSHALDKAATAQLNDVVNQIKAASKYDSIRVEGHASSDGPLENNNVLAVNRANEVRKFLVNSGLASEKVTAIGFGITEPATSNKTLAGRVLNRRATFVVKFVVVKGGK